VIDSEQIRERFIARAPAALHSLIERFAARGAACQLVGGSVRDLILEREIEDWDIATDATPEEVAALFERTTLLHARHGTTQVRVGDRAFEVTTYRVDGPYSDGRHPDFVRFSSDLSEDLARRDFTINAMAYDPIRGEFIDPFGGLGDLEGKILRTVGDPDQRFREDALRLLRAARFVAHLELTVDAATHRALAREAKGIDRIAGERIREEILKILKADRPSVAIEILRECGILARILPELQAGFRVPQNEFHAYDVYDHSLAACDHSPRDKPLVRLAALLHDVGKVPCREERDERVTFYGHERIGARMVESRLRRLRFPNRELRHVTHLIDQHMFHYEEEWSDSAVRRFIARVGVDSLGDLFDLRVADSMAKGPNEDPPEDLGELKKRIDDEIAKENAFTIRDLAVTGNDLKKRLNIDEGPLVGRLLGMLLQHVLEDGEANRRETLMKRAEALLREERNGK